MNKSDNLENKVLTGFKKAGRALKNAAESTADAISGIPATAKTAVIGGAMLAAIAGAGDANAQSSKTTGPADWQAAYVAHSKQAESHRDYKAVHSGDLVTGPTAAEIETAAKLRACYPGHAFDIPSLYKLTRSYGILASQMSGDVQFSRPADSRVSLNAPVKGCQVEFGTTQLKLMSYAGHSLDESLEHWVSGNKSFGFQPNEYFFNNDAQTKALVLDAMRGAVNDLGLAQAFAAQRSKNGFVAIPHEVMLKGVEAVMGLYAPSAGQSEVAQPAAPYVPPAKAVPVAPAQVTPRVQISETPLPQCRDGIDNDGDGRIDGYDAQCAGNPDWNNEAVAYQPPAKVVPAPVVPQVAPVPAPVAPAQIVPQDASAEVSAPAQAEVVPPNPCDDPLFQRSLDEIEGQYEGQIENHVPVADIDSAADVRYDALQEQCPDNAARITGARDALTQVLEQYTTTLANRLHFNLADVGFGLHGGAVSFPNTADGHLHLGWSTAEDAPNPFHISLYVNGGNELVEGFDGGERETPFGGALLNLGGENYQLRLSLNGNWFRQTSAFDSPLTQFGPDTYDIEGGTETASGERSEDGRSVTTGAPMENWFATAEGLVDIGQFELQLGVGFGQFMRHEESVSNVYELTNIMQDSVDQGPPLVGVHTETGADTTVNTLTLTDVLTNLLGLRLGSGLNFDAAGGQMFAGADAQLLYNWSDISGQSEVTTVTNLHDTVTDVDIEGFPSERIVTPGADGQPITTITPHDAEDPSQANLTVRGRVLYDSENLALRLELGPVFQFDSDGYTGVAPLGVAGNITALGRIPQGMILGGNVESNGSEMNLDAMFASHADFQYFVGYVDMCNQLRQASLIDDTLRDSYLNNLFNQLVETSEGFIVTAGARFQAEGMDQTSGHVSVGYAHQFPRMGPLGASVQFDSDDMSVIGTGYVGLTRGLNLRLSYETSEHELGDREHIGHVGLVYHFGNGGDE